MCSTSKVNEMLSSIHSPSVSRSSLKVSPGKLKHSRDKFFLVDIREPDEIESEPIPRDIAADAQVPMGKLLSTVAQPALLEEWRKTGKQIVLLCNSGFRASLAASEIDGAASLTRGLLGLKDPAATVPDLLVALVTKTNAEKLTLALNACAVAAEQGETVVLALMGDGVETFLRKGNNKEEAESFRVGETFIGEPFKPCNALLTKFTATGNATILACKSCVKQRNMEFGSDLLDCVSPMSMPDFLRMMGEAKKTLQFM